ncbi:MAG: zinc ribbon domain-containing protein [Polyangiales bacterium]
MPHVEVLKCKSCGAPIPIGDDDVKTCPHCGAEVVVPSAHRELRELARRDEQNRRLAEAQFDRLDSPPWLATKIAARIFDQPMIGFWFFFGVPVGIWSIIYGLSLSNRIAGAIHHDRREASPVLSMVVIFAILFLFAFIPRVLGVYANRRVTARALLIGGLAARPPRIAGGAYGCRVCGAPLTMPEGATVARCMYCHADSAVRVRTFVVTKTREVVDRVQRTIADAFAANRSERWATLRMMLSELFRYLAWTFVFGGLFAIFAWDDERNKLKGEHSLTAIGGTAMVLASLLLIALPIVSLARADKEDVDRRDGNDVPKWVAYVGPIGVWILIEVVLSLR